MQSKNSNVNEVVHIAKLCARLILENGGETYRAEETVYRICSTFGFDEIDVFAIPTGVFITVSKDGVSTGTAMKRIRKRSVNMKAIETVNNISRQLTGRKIAVSDALEMLRPLCEQKPEKKLLNIAAAGLSSGFFALLFRGSIFDFFVAAFCGAIVQWVAGSIKAVDMFNFAVSILGSFIIALVSVLCVKLTGMGDLEKIIAGAITPLLPGVPMVNAIRDTMRGDLLSGVARGAEALLIAAALAFGIGMVLKLYFLFFA